MFFENFISYSYDFGFSTPALVFSSVSLLMLAYTNRFVVLADLIRELHGSHQNHPSKRNIEQIQNLAYRMNIIKKMQMSGAVSFVLSILSMLLLVFQLKILSLLAFIISLVALIISLLYLLRELSVSIVALGIQLDDIHDEQDFVEEDQ